MSFVERSEIDGLSPTEREILDKAGPLRGLAELLAHRPVLLEQVLRLHAVTFDAAGGLPKADRLLIAVVTARALGCELLVTTYGDALLAEGLDEEMVTALRRDYRLAQLTQRQRAMLDFAMLVTDDVHLVGKVSVDALRIDAEIDAPQVLDVVHITALVNYSSRLIVALGLDPIFPG